MATPKLKYVEIDSTDVSSYVTSFKVTRTKDSGVSTAIISFNTNILTVIDFDEDNAFHEIEIWRGVSAGNEDRIFKGEVYTFTKDGVLITCQCKCELYKAVRASVTKSFDSNIDTEAGNFSEIFSTLMEDYAGLTAVVGDTVQDYGTTHTISKFICNHADVFERCEMLANAIGWQFYYNPEDDKVYFEENGFPAASEILTVGTNVSNNPPWAYDKSQMVNKYKIIGGEDEVETDESFDGDAAEDTFTLSFTPVSVRVTVGGTLQVGGNETTSTTFDYTVDTENKQIVFESGSIPGAGVGNVVVTYTHNLPRPVINSNQDSIDTQGTYEKVSFAIELRDVDDVKTYCRQYIATYSIPFQVCNDVKVIDVSDMFPGQAVTIVDTTHSINKTFYITKTDMYYPYVPDKLAVTDSNSAEEDFGTTVSDRVRRLEETMGQNQDVLIHLFDGTRTIKYRRRYAKLNKRTAAGTDMFILGNPTYGLVGTAKWGDQDMGARSAEVVHQGNDTYREYCYDYDFAIDSNAWTIQDDCDSTAWSLAGNAATPVLNYNTYKTGTTALNLIMNAGGGSSTWYKTLGGTFDGTDKALRVWFRIRDSTAMGKFSAMGNGLQIRVGNDASNYFYYDNPFGTSELIVGWNLLGFDFATAGTVGSPDVTQLDYLAVLVIAEGAGDTFTGDEFIMDTWLTGDSTGKFNMRNNRIDFEADDVWYSDFLFKGTQFTYATLTVGSITGTLTYEVSADGGSTWQAITSGNRITLSSSDTTGVKLRITEGASGTAQINDTTDVYGRVSAPHLTLLMEA
jgi:hypothetical protein